MEGAVYLFWHDKAFLNRTGMRNRHDHGTPRQIGKGREESIGHCRTPVLPHDVRPAVRGQDLDEGLEVQRQGRPVVIAFCGNLRWWMAAQERCNHPMAGSSERSHLMFPGPSNVGITMQQKQQRSRSLFEKGKFNPVGDNASFLHFSLRMGPLGIFGCPERAAFVPGWLALGDTRTRRLGLRTTYGAEPAGHVSKIGAPGARSASVSVFVASTPPII